ncbi:MAG: hypothetical protein HC888_01865 [Candidatus Competibacteraceae bacterium]|nr:hypothetical protein [Candidatus Competibacteraceae bacterium]
MAVISASDYAAIATFYANGYDGQVGSNDYYYDAVYTIVLLDSVQPSVDLLNVFWNTHLIMKDVLYSKSSLLSPVRAINNHVLQNSAFDTIDAYLAAAAVKVPQTWADLCAEAGVTISAGNIL